MHVRIGLWAPPPWARCASATNLRLTMTKRLYMAHQQASLRWHVLLVLLNWDKYGGGTLEQCLVQPCVNHAGRMIFLFCNSPWHFCHRSNYRKYGVISFVRSEDSKKIDRREHVTRKGKVRTSRLNKSYQAKFLTQNEVSDQPSGSLWGSKSNQCACCRRVEPKSQLARCRNCNFVAHTGRLLFGILHMYWHGKSLSMLWNGIVGPEIRLGVWCMYEWEDRGMSCGEFSFFIMYINFKAKRG